MRPPPQQCPKGLNHNCCANFHLQDGYAPKDGYYKDGAYYKDGSYYKVKFLRHYAKFGVGVVQRLLLTVLNCAVNAERYYVLRRSLTWRNAQG